MAENMSPNVHLNGISPEDLALSKVQGKHEVPFSLPGSGTDEEYPFLTPEPKLASQKHDYPSYTSEIFLSTRIESSDISTKEGSETFSSSSSSSDAESGTYEQHVNGDEDLKPKAIDFETDSNAMTEDLDSAKEEREEVNLGKKKDVVHQELLEKVANYEAELEVTKKKLQSSQEEISKLKYENLTLAEELGKTIENLRTSEENMSKMEQDLKNEFEERQHQFQGQLDLANKSIDQLQAELGSERRLISELQEMINKTTDDLNNCGRDVEELKLALHDAHKDFSRDRSLFQQEITSLNEEKFALELRNESLEEKMKQYEIEKIEAQKLLEARETELLRSLDTTKLKYDTLMADRDEVFAKMQTLAAELNARDTSVLQLEEQITKLSSEHMELLNELEKTKKVVEELSLKVLDKEKEMEKQSVIIVDSANEKREAIRQLCFSLEYYRNEYHELRQFFSKYKQPAILAA